MARTSDGCRSLPQDAVVCRGVGNGRYNLGRALEGSRPRGEKRMADPSVHSPPSARPLEDRLHSWKEIASYLKRDVTTVQRWEKREGMPVYRHVHARMGTVYATRADLDAWMSGRNPSGAETAN